ncbi:MAG TPA: energy transducer TonB [Thermomonas sp.]|nr:energy transducer TonB [Thermomonas sp.]
MLYALLAGMAQDPPAPAATGDPVAPPATIAWESTVRPPMRGVIDALRRTKLDGLSAQIKLACDADGNVIDAALLESTGNEALDRAILKWAGEVKLKAAPPGGVGVLPMTLMRPR